MLLDDALSERFILCGTQWHSAGTRRTLRTSLRPLGRAVAPMVGPGATALPREGAKPPYGQGDSHQAASLSLSFDHPSVSHPPEEVPRCCAQRSITVAPQVNEKTRQKHDYAGPAHRDSYARRTAAERTYASLADPSVGGIRRGWCRLFGRTKNTLMYVRAVVVRNVRILESFERRQAEDARRVAVGPTRRRRRRRQRDTAAPEQQPMAEVETAPG
jgi:hypothetical protein